MSGLTAAGVQCRGIAGWVSPRLRAPPAARGVAGGNRSRFSPLAAVKSGEGAAPKAKKKRGGRKKKAAAADTEPKAEAPPPYKYTPPSDEDFPSVFGNYTPANFITFCEEPEAELRHELSVVVNAAPDAIWPFLYDWEQVPKVFDLIDTIGLPPDAPESDAAIVQLFYQFGGLPIMQLVSVIERPLAEENTELVVYATDGMPLRVHVKLTPQNEGATRVDLAVDHVMPVLMRDWVGAVGFGGHVRDILRENLEMLKRLAEGTITEEEREAHYLAMRAPFTVPDKPPVDLNKVDVDTNKVDFGDRKAAVLGDE